MYGLHIKPNLIKKLQHLFKKNKKHYDVILKKSLEIVENPHHYKNLRKPLQFLKRIHIDKHFVLTFSVDDNNKVVTLEDYEHHDKVYKK